MARRLNRFTERAFSMVADTTAQILPPAGEAFALDGIFDNALVETEATREGSSRGGSLKLNRRRSIFTAPSSRLSGVSNAWHVQIEGATYYVADHYLDGKGFMTLWLAPVTSTAPETEEGSDGPAWR